MGIKSKILDLKIKLFGIGPDFFIFDELEDFYKNTLESWADIFSKNMEIDKETVKKSKKWAKIEDEFKKLIIYSLNTKCH